MDRKSTAAKKKSRKIVIPRGIPFNEMKYKTSWTVTAIQTGTTGTTASWTAPSIIHSSEYSIMSSLFTEVRLDRATAIFGPTQSANGSVLHGTLIVGTNMLLNENTGSGAGSYSDIQNLTKPQRISTLSVRETRYRIPVPKYLEFANIADDAPNPPIPWAGSPGIIRWYSEGLTASTVYFTLHLECVYHLRGRQ